MATIKASATMDTSFFKSLKILSEFGDEYISHLLENAYIKRYDKGKLLFLQGDPVTTFYIVRSGWVKLFRNTVDGTEVITIVGKSWDLHVIDALEISLEENLDIIYDSILLLWHLLRELWILAFQYFFRFEYHRAVDHLAVHCYCATFCDY